MDDKVVQHQTLGNKRRLDVKVEELLRKKKEMVGKN